MTMPTTKAARLPSHVRTSLRYARALRAPVNTVLTRTEDTKSNGIGAGKSRSGYSLSDSILGVRLPGVERPLFLFRSRASEFLQRCVDSVDREVVFVAEHAPDAVGIRIAESEFDIRKDVRLQEDLDAELLERRLQRAVFLDQRERLLRPDSFHALVEVRPDQQAHVDELFARDAQVRQGGLEGDLLRSNVHVHLLARQLPTTADGQVLHEARRPEQEGVEILRGRRMCHPALGHRARLRLPFRGRLDPRDPE